MQTKNITKTIVLALLALFFGEGIFGLGVYWPFLFWLDDWRGIYWFGLWFGILVSLVSQIKIGWPSLFFVLVLGAMAKLLGPKRSTRWALVVLGAGLNFVFDKIFGLNWSIWEMFLVLGIGFVVGRDLERQETIRINY